MSESDLEQRIGCIIGRAIGALPGMQLECLREDVRRLVEEIADECKRLRRENANLIEAAKRGA